MDENFWVIVLAAGEGRRLQSLTERLYGRPLPKQFAVLDGELSLLQRTLERLEGLVPPERVVVVVPADYAELAEAQLELWPGIHVLAQPANRGTGPGILLPLAYVLERDPNARVLVTPSDHNYRDPGGALHSAVRRALAAAEVHPLVTIGVAATGPETEYGWMRLGEQRAGARQVTSFVEKPDVDLARVLYEEGALFNTFIMVASAQKLWDRARVHLSEPADAIAACAPLGSPEAWPRLTAAYARLEDRNFSRAVLEREPDLAAVELTDSGWSDLGSPERVFEALKGSATLAKLRAPEGPGLARVTHDRRRPTRMKKAVRDLQSPDESPPAREAATATRP